jgi:hypothetical protein
MTGDPPLERQLALPYLSGPQLELTQGTRTSPVRLIWSLRNADSELACFLVPMGDTVDAQIYEDRTLLLARRWTTERDALLFARALKEDLSSDRGW